MGKWWSVVLILWLTLCFSVAISGAYGKSVPEYGCYYEEHIPKRYDRPYRGKKVVTVDRNIPDCGYQEWIGGVCHITVHPQNRKQNLRHEEAHCNGWGAGHER